MPADSNKRCAHPSCTCQAAADRSAQQWRRPRTLIVGVDTRAAAVRCTNPFARHGPYARKFQAGSSRSFNSASAAHLPR
jgi:hypothetical protein